MPWAIYAFLAIYGILSIVFAFVEPPAFFRSFFRVPSIFVFLPDRWIMPAGRVFVGLVTLGTVGYLIVKTQLTP
jgi:hypothetical protein